jgi:hypothetical protein
VVADVVTDANRNEHTVLSTAADPLTDPVFLDEFVCLMGEDTCDIMSIIERYGGDAEGSDEMLALIKEDENLRAPPAKNDMNRLILDKFGPGGMTVPLEEMDTDGDGTISAAEIASYIERSTPKQPLPLPQPQPWRSMGSSPISSDSPGEALQLVQGVAQTSAVVDIDAPRPAAGPSRAAVGFTPRGMPKPTTKRASGPLELPTMGEPGTGITMREFQQPARGGRDVEAAFFGAVSGREPPTDQRKVRRQRAPVKAEKPLVCGYCEQSFPWGAYMDLLDHQVVAHGATPPTPEQYTAYIQRRHVEAVGEADK